MSEPLSEEKIEALVNLVLQAVDQRLSSVREQLVQITNTVARNHADLEEQIAACRDLIEGTETGVPLSPGAEIVATRQLVEAANILTERVTFLEARVNQYTNERVAELQSAIDRLNGDLGVDPAASIRPGSSARTPSAHLPGESARSVSSTSPSLHSVASPRPGDVVDPNIAPAAARLPPLGQSASQSGERRSPSVEPIDIEQLSAKMGERLSAAIERAINS